MKNLLLLFSFLFISVGVFAQKDNQLNAVLDDAYKAGHKGFLTKFYKTIKYPLAARDNCSMGLSIIEATVDVDGQITDIKKKTNLDNGLDQQVISTLKEMKQWKNLSEPVSFQIKVAFKLEGQEVEKGDVVVVGFGNTSQCDSTDKLLKKLNIARTKQQNDKALEIVEELIRREPNNSKYLKIQDSLKTGKKS
ncbi:MAG: hypothetical protein AAFO07_27170 [Bacteroidota bacterium]